MAVAFGHSSSGNTTSATTSLSFSHTATGDSYLIAIIGTRLNTGGCSASEVTGFSATYNGVSLSFSKGTADTSITYVPTSDCVHGKLMYLANPTTGTNTFSASWTGSAWCSIVVYSFSGASSLGTVVQDTSSGTTHQASATITANDILLGGLVFADATSAVSSGELNYVEVADAAGNQLVAGGTQAYTSGTETISFTTSNFGGITWAIPVLASGGGSTFIPYSILI